MRRRILIALGGAVAALGLSTVRLSRSPGGPTAGVSSVCQSNLNPADDTCSR